MNSIWIELLFHPPEMHVSGTPFLLSRAVSVLTPVHLPEAHLGVSEMSLCTNAPDLRFVPQSQSPTLLVGLKNRSSSTAVPFLS
ncbi:hypothetical protein SH668x_001497 [Planctomicrobium sp. SH668]|uniref:hypothetical protein n=1 Tax=Planctomicrobium sp. SH668 TaxID=3448126 RepID=UPI003F5AE2F6